MKNKKCERIRKDGDITKELWFDISNKSITTFCKRIGPFNKDKIERINRIMGEN